jgi:hypothetical protein
MNMEFVDRMNAGRDAAAARRHKGLSTGKAAAGWNAKPRPAEVDAGEWHYERERIGVAWYMAKSAALDVYVMAVFPERYREGVTIDDMIDAATAAFNESIPF